MPSPFPGMDPYLEDRLVWPEFHGEFVFKIRKFVAAALPKGFVARVDQHVFVTDDDDEPPRVRKPDGFVVKDADEPARAGVTATLTPPLRVVLPQFRRQSNRYVRIVDQRDNQVVTVIEVLSPSNKYAGKDRDAYLAKRNEYLGARVNLIEIDFLRGGQRMPVDVPPAGDYFVLVSRADEFPAAGVWPLSVRDPLPIIPVPLAEGSADIELDLARPFRETYDDGNYARQLDYAQPPVPRLSKSDAVWARELLATRGDGRKPARRRAKP